MLFRLLLMFTIIPLVELFILIKLSSIFGTLTTIAMVIGTGILGAYHAKQQGLSTILRIKQEFQNGCFPGDQMLDGVLLLIAGVVLITPGLLTDIAGFLLLFPTTRNIIKEWIKNMIPVNQSTRFTNINQAQ